MDYMLGVPSRPLSFFTQMAIHILISFDWSQGVFFALIYKLILQLSKTHQKLILTEGITFNNVTVDKCSN